MCHPDPISAKNILLWDDSMAAFDDVLHVRLDPARIAATPGVTLDVVVRAPLDRVGVARLPQELSIISPSKGLSLELPHHVLANAADEGTNTTAQSSGSGAVITPINTIRNPKYGLENTAMDNYTLIDMPDDTKAPSLEMTLNPIRNKVMPTPPASTLSSLTLPPRLLLLQLRLTLVSKTGR
ncbi:hypothetical protein BGZ97_001719 [Linnemannia gamsii]|uniref:Uncharacterized protein n=1 Tax=Linnemannia gamsii TaxID=64522 RepID=A0A9P6UUC1_9FUNG|nr:hypothetical protein BGZ97_001719 [Linnemannia gamsii]